MNFITRLDYTRSRGWWVRIQRVGFKVSRLFSDSRHGGRASALIVAKAFRDGQLRRAPAPRKRPQKPGYGYVSRVVRAFRSRGRWVEYDAWQAWIKVAPKRAAQTSYSVERHGELGAKRMAREWLGRKRATQIENYAARS